MPRAVPENPPGTNGLRRDPALVSLSRDHHDALVHALALRRSADAPGRANGAAEEFLRFYDAELLGHMADEEDVLLPRAAGADAAGAARVRTEHEELRMLAAALRSTLAEGDDVTTLAGELGGLLHDHVRFEERAFFMAVQEALAPDALASLSAALEEHRLRRGRAPGCAVRIG